VVPRRDPFTAETPAAAGGPARLGARLVAAASVVVMLLSAGLLVAAVRVHPSGTTGPEARAATAGTGGPAGAGRLRPSEPPSERPSEPLSARAPARARPTAVAGPRPAGSGRRGTAPRRWRDVLAGLDRRRSRSYAESDPGLLGRVYTPGSAVLRRDRALLLRYQARGLRVRGLRTSVSAVRVRRRAGRTVVLDVGDRVAGGTVLGEDVRRPLPADRADRWVVTLRWRPGRGWRISAVRVA
jgi:hypothetical protein